MGLRSWAAQWQSSTEPENKILRTRYEGFVRDKGELFEDFMVPLTNEDTADALTRRKRFSNIWWICFLALMAFVISAYIFGWDTMSYGSKFEVFMIPAIALIFRVLYMRKFNWALTYKEKRVIKGVITKMSVGDKKIRGYKESGCFIEFSLRFTLQVMPEDYKTLNMGDIIQVEMLDEDVYMKRKFVTLGKI